MPKNSLAKKDSKNLKLALTKKRDQSRLALRVTHKKATSWMDRHNLDLKEIRKKSTKLLVGASLTGSLLLSPPPTLGLSAGESKAKLAHIGYLTAEQLEILLAKKLLPLIPKKPGHVDSETEKKINQTIYDELGITASSTLENQQLNHSIGYIGYEQHLKRFPGDTIYQHDEETQAGITPGLGGWGYFAYSEAEMTKEDVKKEKYYFAVQTMYLPDWQSNLNYLVKWYKHRKMIAINPNTGKAVVGVIADAGPAKWTGKQFGGSPEVMKHLGLSTQKKGKIILYFVDDIENKIPLGPVRQNYNLELLKEA